MKKKDNICGLYFMSEEMITCFFSYEANYLWLGSMILVTVKQNLTLMAQGSWNMIPL